MKISLNKPRLHEDEDKRGIIQALLTIPPSARHDFYKSAEGRQILKGIGLVSENDKSPVEGLGDKREWSKEDIEAMVNKIREASPEEKEIIFAFLPGPVVGIVMNRLGAEDPVKITKTTRGSEVTVDDKRQGNDKPVAAEDTLKKGIRGPVKGTPGYFQWVERLRASRAAKRAVTDAAKKSPTMLSGKPAAAAPVKPVAKVDKKASEDNSSEDGKKKNYKRFVGKIGKKS